MKEYNTVLNEACIEQTEKKSRFICSVKPVENEDEALDFIRKTTEKFKGATHNVYAYVINNNCLIQRYSDDGEPQGTAGIPVLEVIKREELSNLCVIVTRYFGGILLGASGLIRAYSSAAKEGINAAKKCKMSIFYKIVIQINYSQLGKVQNSIVSLGHNILDIEYSEFVQIKARVKYDEYEKFISIINEITNGDCIIECIEKYHDVLEIY